MDDFVGRDGELGTLRSALESASAARPRVVLLHGPAGMGRTALIRRFLRSAQVARVLQASGDEVETALPYGVVTQLLADLPPALSGPLSSLAAEAGPSADPLTVGAGLVQLLGALQDEGTAVVVVDDAHWADSPSLNALTFALRRLRMHRVLTLVSARQEALDALPASLRQVVASDVGADLPLGGLGLADLRHLVARLGAGPLPPGAVQRLADHTGGNPLHVRALLEELSPEDLLAPELPAPRSFSALVLSRLASSPPTTEALVAAASVLGLRCPFGLAARLGEVDGPLAALEAALAAGLLETCAGTTTSDIAFTHALVRAAVYHHLPPTRRAALHARAAELVEDEGSALRHRVAATPAGDAALAKAVDEFARGEVGRGAWAAAGAAFLSAARATPARIEREQRVMKAVDCLLQAGDFTQAAGLTEEFTNFLDTPRRRCTLGQLAVLSGQAREAERLLVKAWEGCDTRADPELAARVATNLAAVHVAQGRGRQTVQWARRALEALPEISLGPGNPRQLLLVGLAAAGRLGEALVLSASVLARPADDAQRIQWLSGRGTVRMWTDDLKRAREDLAHVADVCCRQGPFDLGLVARLHLSECEYRLGCWDEAILHGELAVSAAEQADQAWTVAPVHAVAALPLAGRGDWQRAEAHARTATEAARGLGTAADVTWAAMATARLSLARGQYERATTALAPVLELARHAPALEEPGIQPWRELLAEALVRLGRLEEAEDVLEPLEARATERRRHSSLAGAARVRALLEAAQGRGGEAEAAFESALAHAAEVDMPFERALVDDAYGRFLRRAGRRRRARERLGRAQEVYARVGAKPLLERVERELAACGLVRRSQAAQPELTHQELAVATLVAAGKTNREVATELLVSAKTVGYHLSNVYAKLGVSSRTQLAARFAAARR